jgi:hypothetical protein
MVKKHGLRTQWHIPWFLRKDEEQTEDVQYMTYSHRLDAG